jgi:Protein of unknown function (DUF2510)
MSVAAGWYTDPQDATFVRWWDGIQWTEHTQNRAKKLLEQLQGVAPPAPASQPSSTAGLVMGGRGKSADEMRQARRTDNGVQFFRTPESLPNTGPMCSLWRDRPPLVRPNYWREESVGQEATNDHLGTRPRGTPGGSKSHPLGNIPIPS